VATTLLVTAWPYSDLAGSVCTH